MPLITPTPHNAIAEPCFSGGFISSNVACDNGIKDAPNTPWNNLKLQFLQ
jgi:hypothetical protein